MERFSLLRMSFIQVFSREEREHEDTMLRAVGDSARARMLPKDWMLEQTKSSRENARIARPLQVLTGREDVFDMLHRYVSSASVERLFLLFYRQFVWILRTQNNRCVELVMEGHPSQDILVAMEQAADEADEQSIREDEEAEAAIQFEINDCNNKGLKRR